MNHLGHLETNQGRQSVCIAGVFDRMKLLTAKDVMQYGVVSIDRREPVHKAVSLMLERDISGLPVTYYGRLCGMLSERDLLRLMHDKAPLPQSVEECMVEDVTSFDVDDKLADVCKQLVESPFRRAPILLPCGTLAGIISRADLIRVCKVGFQPLTPHRRPEEELLAQDVMRHGLLTLPVDASPYDAMDMIVKRHVTGLPVVNDAMRLLGLVTEKDVLAYCMHPFPVETTVAAFMTANVVAFDRKTSLDVICRCLIERDFHRVPILDADRLVGIISRSDILRSRVAVFKR